MSINVLYCLLYYVPPIANEQAHFIQKHILQKCAGHKASIPSLEIQNVKGFFVDITLKMSLTGIQLFTGIYKTFLQYQIV